MKLDSSNTKAEGSSFEFLRAMSYGATSGSELGEGIAAIKGVEEDNSKTRIRPRGLVIVSILMLLFGLAEVVTGVTGNFLDVLSATRTLTYTLASTSIGSFYSIAGLLILTMRKWGAALAIVFLVADIAGRFTMVLTGLFPFDGINAESIVAGTVIAAIFTFYIAWSWKKFT